MGQDLEVRPNSATALPSLSPPDSLAKALTSPTEWFEGSHGFDTRAAPWKPPAVITDSMRKDAEQSLPIAQALCDPAPKDRAKQWLATLGTIVAGNMPAAEAQMRLKAYVGLIEIPAGMMTRQLLDRAGRRFKFFPSYSELAEFVDEEKHRLEETARRLRIIAEGEKRQAIPSRGGGFRQIGDFRPGFDQGAKNHGKTGAQTTAGQTVEQRPAGEAGGKISDPCPSA